MVGVASSPLADATTTDDNKPLSFGSPYAVHCSVCFDLVMDNGERSIAKLNCGHRFHLDCIGSAFNTKGSMQCPNCRKVESGRWLFANGSAHGISEDDNTLLEEMLQTDFSLDFSHSIRPFEFHWCPYNGFTLPSSNEEAESSLNTFPNFYGNRAMAIENIPGSARSHVSHLRPNDIGNSNFSHHQHHHHHPMSSHSAPHDTLRSTNIQHPNWGWNCHFLPYSDREFIEHNNLTPVNSSTSRPTHGRAQADAVARTSSFPHPSRYSQQPIARPGERSVASSQPTETTNTPSSGNGFRRFSGARGMPMIMPAVPNRIYFRSSGGGLYFRDMERDESFSHALPAGYRRVSRSSNSSNRAQWF